MAGAGDFFEGLFGGLLPEIKEAVQTRAKQAQEEQKRQKEFNNQVELIFKRGTQDIRVEKEKAKMAQEQGFFLNPVTGLPIQIPQGTGQGMEQGAGQGVGQTNGGLDSGQFRLKQVTAGPTGQRGTFERVPSEAEFKEELGKTQQTKEAESIATAKGKELGEGIKAQRAFRQTVGSFRELISQIRGAGEEQGGFGLIPGIVGTLKAGSRLPGAGRIRAARTQKVETTFKLNSLLTGQNRVIRGVVQLIGSTLPEAGQPSDTIAQLTRQSIRNSFRLSKSFKEAGLTPGRLGKMSQEDLDALNVQAIFNATSLTPAEEEQLEELVADVLNTPASKPVTLGTGEKNVQSEIDAINKELAELGG